MIVSYELFRMNFSRFASLTDIPNLQHAIATRESGVSRGEYSSLNLAFHVGDNPNCAVENRKRLGAALGFDASTLVAAQQVHGTNSFIATREYSGRGALDWESAIPDCDALIVQEKQIPVLIQVADCAPVLIVDPVQKVLAVVHAGWRGAFGKIASQTLAKMQRELGSRRENLRVGIGPCLCVSCLEIGEEVASQVSSTHVARRDDWPKPHLDLRGLIENDLTACGVLASRIETMNQCPRCENQIYFSHRGQNGKAGRFGLVAWWE